MGSPIMSAARVRLALYVAAGLALGALAAVVLVANVRERLFKPLKISSIGRALVGGPFTLTDHTGKRISDTEFRGKFLLVVFGFTFCPDVCPSELQLISAALDRLGDKAQRIVPLFITVDPERDTP